MPHRIPVPETAVRDIKWLAKRFSKRLQAQTSHRLKGQSLYQAFAKPLGYDTFNQLQQQSARSSHSSFDYDAYFGVLKRELRKHLPVLLDGVLIADLLDASYDPGTLFLNILGKRTPPEITQQIIKHPAYRHFLAEYRDTYGDLAKMLELVAPDTPLPISDEPQSFIVTFDLSGWNNEGNPFTDLASYKAFMHLLSDLQADELDVFVRRIGRDGGIEELVRMERNGKEHWQHNVEPVDREIQALLHTEHTADGSIHRVYFAPSRKGKSFLAHPDTLAAQIAGLIPGSNDPQLFNKRFYDLFTNVADEEDDLSLLQQGLDEEALQKLRQLDRPARDELWKALAKTYSNLES